MSSNNKIFVPNFVNMAQLIQWDATDSKPTFFLRNKKSL